MVREPKHISLFNTQLLRTKPYDQYLLDEFAPSVKMSTYLVAFVVCDFDSLNGITPSGINVRINSEINCHAIRYPSAKYFRPSIFILVPKPFVSLTYVNLPKHV